MDVAALLDDAAWSVREYAVYLSYDRDAASARGDRGAADLLERRWHAAGALAAQLEDLNPRTVDDSAHELREVRTLLHQLAWRVDRLTPSRASFVTVAGRDTARRRKGPRTSPTREFMREDGAEHATPVDFESACEHCGQSIPVRAEGRPRRYCDARCRNAAARARRHAQAAECEVPRAG